MRTVRAAKGRLIRKFAFGCVLLCASLAAFGASGQIAPLPQPEGSTPDQSQTVDSLINQLKDISTVLNGKSSSQDLAKLGESLPKEWTVATPERQFKISTGYLRTQLVSGSADNARVWTAHLSRLLQGYLLTESKSSANPRVELDRILGGSEFAAVHPPTAWELFRQRLNAWITRQLLRLFGAMDRYPIGGQILFWIFIIACVAFIAMWLFRFLISRDRMEALPPGQVALASRTWQEWIRAAREAAARNDFREAVHSAYWAGISRMEDLGVLPKDRSMTPREYLRLVVEPAPGELIPRTRYREPLSALTTRLERIWYANRGAHSEDYQESLRQLEALGCQLE